MTNPNQNMNKAENNEDNSDKFNAEIKKTWSKLSDDDVKSYKGNRDQFFVKLKEKQNVSREDGEKKSRKLKKPVAKRAARKKPETLKQHNF